MNARIKRINPWVFIAAGSISLLLSVGIAHAARDLPARLQLELAAREKIQKARFDILKPAADALLKNDMEGLELARRAEKDLREFDSNYGPRLASLNRSINGLQGAEILCAFCKWLFSGVGVILLASALYLVLLRRKSDWADQIASIHKENESAETGKLISTNLRWFDWGIILLVAFFCWLVDPIGIFMFLFFGDVIGYLWHFALWPIPAFVMVKLTYGITLKKVWNVMFPNRYEWECSKCESTVSYGEKTCPTCETILIYEHGANKISKDSSESVSGSQYKTCPQCKFEQWAGYSECQKCGAIIV